MNINESLNIIKRGAEEIIPEAEFAQKLKKGKPLRVKFGADPTAPDIHLGHMVVLKKLRQFQDLGHKIIFIIGDFTAMIGDPSGRSKTRPSLTKKEILQNAETYQKQVFKILNKDKCEIVYNSQWLEKLKLEDVLKLAGKYTVARILERDDFSNRYNNNIPISLHEFLYPLMQGYDSVFLNSDIEVGGTDQKFNLLVGRELQKEYGKTPQAVLTMPILEGLDGKNKMSKSLGNYVGINDSSKDMFGKLMSIPDTLITKYMKLLTDTPLNEINDAQKAINEKKVNPRDLKLKLAAEVTKFFYGNDEAAAARENFITQFSKKKIPDDIPFIPAQTKNIIDLITELNCAPSRADAKRLIKQGAVAINDKKINEIGFTAHLRSGEIVKIGKKRLFKVK